MLLLCFYMLFEAVKSYCVTRRTRTTREAASLSNRLLPAEAGKKTVSKGRRRQTEKETNTWKVSAMAYSAACQDVTLPLGLANPKFSSNISKKYS